MAKEMAREGELESPASPDTPALSDQHNYLFAEVQKATQYPVAPAPGSWVGVALALQLRGSDHWFTSNHGVPDWSIQRDDPAATTIELPPGTPTAAIAAVRADAVPVGTPTVPPPADYRITVTALRRGFLLRRDLLPGKSLLDSSGNVTLTPAAPAAVLWRVRAVTPCSVRDWPVPFASTSEHFRIAFAVIPLAATSCVALPRGSDRAASRIAVPPALATGCNPGAN